jgi:hypothetical protein
MPHDKNVLGLWIDFCGVFRATFCGCLWLLPKLVWGIRLYQDVPFGKRVSTGPPSLSDHHVQSCFTQIVKIGS